MSQLITILWRDIPSQIITKDGKRKSSRIKLSERFQVAIDRAAMKAGRQGSEEYLTDWRHIYQKCEGDLKKLAKTTAEQLEARYSDEKLEQLVRSRGFDESS